MWYDSAWYHFGFRGSTIRRMGNKGQSVARARIEQYVDILTYFSALAPNVPQVDWESVPHRDLFDELKDAGYVTGILGNACKPGSHLPSGEMVLAAPCITPTGVSKLAEFSDFLWKSSPMGQFTAALMQALWILLGAFIGCVLTVYVSGN